jgi:hypothetical protein
LDSKELAWMWKLAGEEADECFAHGEGSASLSEDERQVFDSFLMYSCKPNLAWLEGIEEACMGEVTPAWCDSEEAIFEKLGMKSYLQTSVGLIKAAQSPLERYNLMLSLLVVARAHFITEFPSEDIEREYRNAVVAFLESAKPSDVLSVAKELQKTWVGIQPSISLALREYAQGPGDATAAERDGILEYAAKRFGK